MHKDISNYVTTTYKNSKWVVVEMWYNQDDPHKQHWAEYNELPGSYNFRSDAIISGQEYAEWAGMEYREWPPNMETE